MIRILDFAAEAGLVVTLHNDVYPAQISHDGRIKSIDANIYVNGLKQLCAGSPHAKVI